MKNMNNIKPNSETVADTRILGNPKYMYICGPQHKKQGMSRNTIAIRSSVIMTETVRLLSITASHMRRQQRKPANMNDLLVASSRIGNRCITALLTSHYRHIDTEWVTCMILVYFVPY